MADKTQKVDETNKKSTEKAEKAKVKRSAAVSKPPIASPSTSKYDDSVGDSSDKVLSLLQQIQSDQKNYDKKVDNMMERIKSLEQCDFSQGCDHEYDYEYDSYEHNNPAVDVEEGELDEQSCEVGTKRKFDPDSRFAGMSKRSKGQEITGEDLEPCLASNLTELFQNGMDEEQYASLVKDENNPRPHNCEGLSTVKVNRVIWEIVSTQNKFVDKKFQNAETALVKGSILVSRVAHGLAQLEAKTKEYDIDISPYLDKCNDALSLFGHANRLLNLGRREVLKPDLKDYSHLCNPSVPITTQLFGDDISKTIKEVDEGAKIGRKIQHGREFDPRGRGRGFYRGRMRGRGRGFPRKPFDSQSSSLTPAKNSMPRRGQRGYFRN